MSLRQTLCCFCLGYMQVHRTSFSSFFIFFFYSDAFEPEIIFNLQEKSKDSVPDATITQEGFKIIVETKMGDWFNSEQLLNHLKAFGDEKSKVILTLAPELMNPKKLNEITELLNTYNATQNFPVNHVNTTFEGIANAIREFIDDRDYEMQDVLNDFLDYCNDDNLIKSADSWKRMRMQLASATFEFNFSNDCIITTMTANSAHTIILVCIKIKV